ncbi:MAG TPA: hypothetical protein VHF24_05305 [Acidimicrobiales bacterium]|nr:hypothetical protein [Acidimicrobiales bacterium]
MLRPRRTTRSPRSVSRSARDERGGGPLSAWFGFVVFLALLLLAVQVLYNLYATSVVTSVAFDAARRVAAAEGGPGAVGPAVAEAEARQALGRYGERVTFEWAVDGDVVALRVRAENPSFLLPAQAGPVAFGDIDRTVRVRVERFR